MMFFVLIPIHVSMVYDYDIPGGSWLSCQQSHDISFILAGI